VLRQRERSYEERRNLKEEDRQRVCEALNEIERDLAAVNRSHFRKAHPSRRHTIHQIFLGGSGSTLAKEIDAQKLYYCHRNLLRAILKNCGPSLGWALRNYLLFTLMMAAGFSILEPRKAIAAVKAVLWNLANLRDTYVWRSRIQANRNANEAELLRSMYPNLKRHQPPDRPRLRRILNILFEQSQGHYLLLRR